MEILNYSVKIKADKEKIWNSMIDSKTYNDWAKAFSKDSQFKGEWIQGNYIYFIDPNFGGTKALLENVKPFDHIKAKHVAIIGTDGQEDTKSDMAKKWIGALESYQLKNDNGTTELFIEIKTHEEFVKMFNDCWPKALQLLKEIVEKNT